jgi:hypothetical protein|tara:strand:+ start:2564 stop:2953 length:390 start_codon:yes stop_codon:yes gene_type:complete
MANDKSNSELVRELLEAFTSLKAKMEDPNYVQLEASIKQVIGNQNDMKEDVSELKKRLLNPYDGAIVEISKNTDFRKEQERNQSEYDKLVDQHKELIQWKSTYTKIFWTLFTAAVGVIGYMVTNIMMNK